MTTGRRTDERRTADDVRKHRITGCQGGPAETHRIRATATSTVQRVNRDVLSRTRPLTGCTPASCSDDLQADTDAVANHEREWVMKPKFWDPRISAVQ